MRRPLSDRDADALLRGPELAGFVEDLQAMAAAAPVPSAALAAMLADGLVPDATATAVLPVVRPRKRWLIALPITGVLMAGTLGAASANVLPDGAQKVVSDTVSSITPIHLPKPVAKPKPTPEPTARLAPSATAAPSEDPKPTQRATVRPSRSPEPGDDHQGPRGGSGSSPRPFRTPEPGDDGHRGPTSGPTPGPTFGSGGDDDGHHDDGGHGDDHSGPRHGR